MHGPESVAGALDTHHPGFHPVALTTDRPTDSYRMAGSAGAAMGCFIEGVPRTWRMRSVWFSPGSRQRNDLDQPARHHIDDELVARHRTHPQQRLVSENVNQHGPPGAAPFHFRSTHVELTRRPVAENRRTAILSNEAQRPVPFPVRPRAPSLH